MGSLERESPQKKRQKKRRGTVSIVSLTMTGRGNLGRDLFNLLYRQLPNRTERGEIRRDYRRDRVCQRKRISLVTSNERKTHEVARWARRCADVSRPKSSKDQGGEGGDLFVNGRRFEPATTAGYTHRSPFKIRERMSEGLCNWQKNRWGDDKLRRNSA